jgi:[CysO sulfur-carrier protein]-S-L-cysteine hydrolase
VTPVAIPGELLEAMYAHAIAAFPDECCGYLIGRSPGAADGAVACRNAQRDGEHPVAPARGADTGFVITGEELFRFARSFDGERPARIVYHSHTNGRAYFSTVDRQVAAGPAWTAGPRGSMTRGGPAYPVQHVVMGVAPSAAADVAAPAITEIAQFAWSDAEGDFVEVARWTREAAP